MLWDVMQTMASESGVGCCMMQHMLMGPKL